MMGLRVGIVLASMFFLFGVNPGIADNEISRGSISGTVADADTKEPLPGANVLLLNANLGAATDLEGHFIIRNVPVGNYSLQFGFIGYETETKPDVIVRPKRITTANAELTLSSLEM